MNRMQAPSPQGELTHRLGELLRIGVALSKERDINRLLEAILIAAKDIANADGGTLYRMTDEQALRFEIMRNDSLGIAMGGTSGIDIPFYTSICSTRTARPSTAWLRPMLYTTTARSISQMPIAKRDSIFRGPRISTRRRGIARYPS